MSEVDQLINKFNNNNNSDKHKKNFTEYDLQRLKVKMQIDKKFIKLYTKNEETLKMFVDKNIEEKKDEALIKGLREHLFGKNKRGNEERELLKIFQGDEKQKRIIGLILYIRERMDYLENIRKNMIEEQIINFKERQDVNEINLDVKQLMQKELVKKCLFGSSSNI